MTTEITMEQITEIVARHLDGQPTLYLQEIVAHGIHNLTNDFHGNSDEDYNAFEDEFARQAAAKLSS